MARSMVIPTAQLPQNRKKWGYGSHRNPLNYLARHAGRHRALPGGNAPLALIPYLNRIKTPLNSDLLTQQDGQQGGYSD
jgi:hypothetical protein